jgi:hypothetical protein
LETYGHNHREEWQRLLGIKAGLKPGAQAMPWVKEHSAQILSCIPATGEELARLAGQLGLEFA